MKNITKKIIILVVVLLLCIPIIADIASNRSLSELEYKDFEGVIDETSRYGFALVYVGKDNADTKKELKKIISDHKSGDSVVLGYYINAEELSAQEMKKLVGSEKVNDAYIFISNGEVIRTETKALKTDDIKAYVDEYTVYTGDKLNTIRKDLTYYKVLKTAKEYKKLVDAKKTVTMAVFGRNSCFYCNHFKPVYNTVAEEYNLDIYYFDSDSYDTTEYANIMNMGLVIPASCSDTKAEKPLSSGFGTPLTLFTKNGEVIDCISGYVGKRALVSKLETVGMIKKD